MGSRFVYSRWDGTQRGLDLDAESLLDGLSDDLLHHGDLEAALRQLMREGLDLGERGRLEGLSEVLDRLREERARRLEEADPDGRLAAWSRELEDIIDEERHAIDRAASEAERSGDERRMAAGREAAANRHASLELLPDALPDRIDSLRSHDFESREAARRLEDLVERIRAETVQEAVDRLAEGMQATTPEDVARVREMLSELNEMVARRDAGEDPGFEEFMERFGDMFPDDPQSLDELLESMARRMAAAQALMNSMTPEQRAQLAELAERFAGDGELARQMGALSDTLRRQFGDLNWDASYPFSGDGSSGREAELRAAADLGDLDLIEQILSGARGPGALSELDPQRVEELLGSEAARSISEMARLSQLLEDAGLAERREGRLQLTPRGLRAIGQGALREIFASMRRERLGGHPAPVLGRGSEASHETKPHEFGDPFDLDLHRTIRNAISRSGPGTPVGLEAEDFEVVRSEHLSRAATVVMVDLSMSMPMRGNFLPAKKTALALHTLIRSRYPRDFLGLVGFASGARELTAEELPEVSWDYEYGTNMQLGLRIARRMLSREHGMRQVVMITDGEPTAHQRADGRIVFDYPPTAETVGETLAEVARCTRAGITINTFVLDATSALTAFVDRMSAINRGRAFYTTNDRLGDFVLDDFVEGRRRRTSTRRIG